MLMVIMVVSLVLTVTVVEVILIRILLKFGNFEVTFVAVVDFVDPLSSWIDFQKIDISAQYHHQSVERSESFPKRH